MSELYDHAGYFALRKVRRGKGTRFATLDGKKKDYYKSNKVDNTPQRNYTLDSTTIRSDCHQRALLDRMDVRYSRCVFYLLSLTLIRLQSCNAALRGRQNIPSIFAVSLPAGRNVHCMFWAWMWGRRFLSFLLPFPHPWFIGSFKVGQGFKQRVWSSSSRRNAAWLDFPL